MTLRLVPPLAHGNARTRVLLHVVSNPRPSVRSCAEAVGLTVGGAAHHLRVLRDYGLVEWEDGKQFTLRAVCRPVPFDDGDAA